MNPSSLKRASQGFTLIEVMITVAIVAILAAVAYPSYTDFVLRGRLVDATNALSTMRADMERHFQDNRTYATVGAFVSPCLAGNDAARTFGGFVLTCAAAPTGAAFVLSAAGSGFVFTIDNIGTQTSTGPFGTSANTWILKRGQK